MQQQPGVQKDSQVASAAEAGRLLRLPGGALLPAATYRLQLNADFTFDDARALVPYLARLGIGALYASPVFAASPGSAHGYDVSDYAALSSDLGDEAAFDRLSAALRQRGMGLLLDVVPNHMGIGHGVNLWWQDVLENGQASEYADFFDIDWAPLKREL
ncbi:MAG: malto-oligosyltrehalose synthase, partial [Thermomicrobiales bacterium]|nr:malto-oligosyltrehalose synthase [Thermomicrobiales bacterium]